MIICTIESIHSCALNLPVLDRQSVVPLYNQIQQHLLGQIRSGKLKSGAFHPRINTAPQYHSRFFCVAPLQSRVRNGMEVRINDAPRANEIMVVTAVTDSGRALPRVGGLSKD
jgi:hypothetical protein